MKTAIYYFSGTGNSQYVAEQMKLQLENLSHEVVIQSIEEEVIDFDVDLLILGGPIYAGNIPEKMIRWILRHIPQTTNTKAVVYTTSAGLKNANGVTSMGDKLIKKGYELLATPIYEMPRNYYFDGYEQTPYEEALEKIRHTTERIGEEMLEMLTSNSIVIEEKVLKYDLLEEVMSVMTRFMGKNYVIGSSCIQCGLCQKSCPMSNINLSKKKAYGLKCMMCTRCLHQCPVNAITYKGIAQEQYKLQVLMDEI